MELCFISVRGFRRFEKESTLNTNGKLVAILGPNESGKSSLLRAVSLLANDEPPSTGDFARGAPKDTFLIRSRYHLNSDDLAAANISNAQWFDVHKRADGVRRYSIEPKPAPRDIRARGKLADGLKKALSSDRFAEKLTNLEEFDNIDSVLAILRSENEDLNKEDIEAVEKLVIAINRIIDDRDTAAAKRIPRLISDFQSAEKALNPYASARSALKGRLPSVLVFDETARALASNYDMDSLNAPVPPALENLLRVAQIDPAQIIAAREQDDSGDMTTLERRANKALKDRFTQDWQQSGVSVSLRFRDDIIEVQVVNAKEEVTSFAERSDGLRQFVALQTFATGMEAKTSILIVDEADQKLHYDAQADLVQMLARQNISSKVIYTTHSAGCLTEDLGNGVRLARPSKSDETRSEIINKFWSEDQNGLTPLLFGMGASTLAFFPTRKAVVVEGASDMLLMPSMFREALNRDVLGFQFVPGAAAFDGNGDFHPPVLGCREGILYLFDGDKGGDDLAKRFRSSGIAITDIYRLSALNGGASDIEDFIDPTLLRDALRILISKFYVRAKPVDVDSIISATDMASIKRDFKARLKGTLSRVDLAYEILELLLDDPSRRILNSKRRVSFKRVAQDIANRFAQDS
jgi:predicted ATP-dependent endonuclease of OLD family